MATRRSASLTRPRGERITPHIKQQQRSPFAPIPPIPGFSPRAEDRVAHFLRRIPPVRLVLGAGAVSGFIYLSLVLAFPITKWWDHPHTGAGSDAINDMGRITGYSPLAAAGFVLAILVLFVCQFFVLTATAPSTLAVLSADDADRKRRALLERLVLLLPLAFAAILIWMQPVTTTDLYGYVARGYLFAHLHLN